MTMTRARRPPAVARVLERVTATVRKNEMVGPGDLVVVAVSGGPDSVCLLYSLWYLRRLLKIGLVAFHFDHRLRLGSASEAAYVRAICARLRVPLHERVAEGGPGKGESVEAWATAARMSAANDLRGELGGASLAEGHTLDDQAETVLLNLVRGTGLEGIVGILPGDRNSTIVQPLLDVTRDEVEAFCRALHLRPRRDPMNDDRRFLRAVVRHDVLPMLEEVSGRGVKSAIARTAENLRSDRDELYASGLRAYGRIVDEADDGVVRFDAGELGGLPASLAARVVRLAVSNALSTDWAAPWSKPAIEAVLDLAEGRPGRRRDLPDGRVARRDRTHVIVERRG